MKSVLVFSVVIIISITLGNSCISDRYTVINFENNSDKVIDTAIIHIQNYKLSLFNIDPHTNIKRQVPKDSIASNKHDIMIRVYLFDKDKSQFKGGFYYNDLSGLLSNNYTLTLDSSLNTIIR